MRKAGQSRRHAAGHPQEVLAQRVAGETVPEEEAAQVGMVLEADPHQVVELALLQQRAAIERHQRWQVGLVVVIRHALERQQLVPVQRLQVVDDLEVGLPVHRREVGEEDEIQRRIVAQERDRRP